MKLWQQGAGMVLLFWNGVIGAATIPLGGIPLNITLTNLPQITVEKPGGGWYNQLTLSNSAGSDITRYQAQALIQVKIRNDRHFMVSLVNPLVLSHATNTSLTFSTELVGFGSSVTTLQALSATPMNFSNSALVGDTSIGNYLLSVSARQPTGEWGNISGNYQGQLVLLFEVKV